MKKIYLSLALGILLAACGTASKDTAKSPEGHINPEVLLLKDYAPTSAHKIQETRVERAKYPIIDMHSHDYATTQEEIDAWVVAMDSVGVEYTNLLSCSWIGDPLDKMLEKYAKYPTRFKLWTSFDYTDFDSPDWEQKAIATLVRHHELGAVGVGEMGDKGEGDLYGYPTEGRGIHIDNPRLRPLLAKCAELGMPINIHIAEPIWMYEPMDETNDGLMNGYDWAVDLSVPGILGYDELITTFENAVRDNPNTTFIACHYLNMSHDFGRLSAMMDKYPNMYLDISARVAEAATTPRAAREFIIKYADRIFFGTDNGMEPEMYRNIFRITETSDEHIIKPTHGYRWPLSGFYLPDDVLKKLYRDNALKLMGKK